MEDINNLNKIYEILQKCLDDFQDNFHDSRNGRNAKIRNSAQRKVDNAINLAQRWIESNTLVYKIASGGEDERSDYGRAVYIEETFRSDYFEKDMREILKNLKVKIDSLNEEK